jgi:pyruvate kinase
VLKVVGAEPSRALVAARKTTYFVPGTHLRHCPEGQESSRPSSRTAVGALPPLPAPIVLHVGDQLWLTAPGMEGRPALLGPDGTTRQPARVSMSRPEILGRVAPGERVAIDDGKVWGTVEESGADGLRVRVTHARIAGARLLPGKSVAFPDSDLGLPAIGESDLPALAFAAAHADLLGLSFAERPEDVHALRDRLAALSTRAIGIVLKIETRRGFERLPELLLAGLCHPVSAVMIARGDLAVDCGYERLAEVQEEILWMAEAAHVPVIWATQVLEDLTKTGQPTRAEITDAAMGERAECVMLNKGDHIVAAVKMLSGVLERMEEHQAKKTARLRPLAMARRFQDPGAPTS